MQPATRPSHTRSLTAASTHAGAALPALLARQHGMGSSGHFKRMETHCPEGLRPDMSLNGASSTAQHRARVRRRRRSSKGPWATSSIATAAAGAAAAALYGLLIFVNARRVQPSPCAFCAIAKEAGMPGSKVIYQDSRVIAFPDRSPAARQHYLVIPRHHIANTRSLQAGDADLVRHMQAVGRQLLEGRQQYADSRRLVTYKFGFHKPPFRSVDHLHLHAFELPHKWYRWVQYQSSLNWISADELVEQLRRLPSPSEAAAVGVNNTRGAGDNDSSIAKAELDEEQCGHGGSGSR